MGSILLPFALLIFMEMLRIPYHYIESTVPGRLVSLAAVLSIDTHRSSTTTLKTAARETTGRWVGNGFVSVSLRWNQIFRNRKFTACGLVGLVVPSRVNCNLRSRKLELRTCACFIDSCLSCPRRVSLPLLIFPPPGIRHGNEHARESKTMMTKFQVPTKFCV